jgi:hypothetical protein
MWDFTGDDQQSVQKSLMLLAVLAVPWMWTSKLCTKTLL